MKVPMKMLHIHVAATTALENLTEEDESVPGIYEVAVKPHAKPGVMLWAALEAFHQKTGIEELDDFDIDVIDPATGAVFDHEQEEPGESDAIHYAFNGKISDTLPGTRLVMTIDVTFSGRSVTLETLKEEMMSTFRNEIDNRSLILSANAEIDDEYQINVVEAATNAAAV